MEIRGNDAYLNESEQIRSELTSPIHFAPESILRLTIDTAAAMERYKALIDADHNEGLPHERANALREYALSEARNTIYSKILADLIFRGEISPSAVEAIRQ